MRRLFFAAALAILFGCAHDSTMYVEGTRFRMGVYVPWDGQLYGLQFCEYLNGSACVTSNGSMVVERHHSATNSYLGLVHTVERTDTHARTR